MSNSLELFNKIMAEGYAGIFQMYHDNKEESLILDFKKKSRITENRLEETDKKVYAKALSGFSNSAGGVIVWGVICKSRGKEEADVVQSLEPIQNLRKFLTDLNAYLPDAIFPINSGIDNQMIFDPHEEDSGFVVTYVPESSMAPCRSMYDYIYYTRNGSQTLKMEHFTLADMFGRRQQPKLEIGFKIYSGATLGNEVAAIIKLGIKNTGRYLAKHPSLQIKTLNHKFIGYTNTYGRDYWVIKDLYLSSLNESFIWQGTFNEVVHPKNYLEVGSIERLVNARTIAVEKGLSFKYEIYAEGSQAVVEDIFISEEQLINSLGLYF